MADPIFEAKNYDWEGHYDLDTTSYAFFNTKDFETIFHHKKNKSENSYQADGFLKIVNGKRRIFLRYKAIPVIKKGQVALSYDNLCRLGATPNNNENVKVQVSPSNYFCNSWFNIRTDSRWNFRIAVVGLILALISIIKVFI